MKLGILTEKVDLNDLRVVFSPEDLSTLKTLYPDLIIKVESSELRAFSDAEYIKNGIEVTNDIGDCDCFFGINELAVNTLIANKSFFISTQNINNLTNFKKLLQKTASKNSVLYNFDAFVNGENEKFIDYTKHNGFLGSYNTFRAFGAKFELYKLPKTETFLTKEKMVSFLKRLVLPPIKIVVTGQGKVTQGIREFLALLKIKEVSIENYLSKNYAQAVYVRADVLDFYIRNDGQKTDLNDFINSPENYCSNFERFAKVSDICIAGHSHMNNAPQILTRIMLNSKDCKIRVVGDLTPNLNKELACSIKNSTTSEPFYGYFPIENSEVDMFHPAAIVVTSVSNFEYELPCESSKMFAKLISEQIIPALFDNDKDGILANAKIN
jgi:hypothetical protein